MNRTIKGVGNRISDSIERIIWQLSGRRRRLRSVSLLWLGLIVGTVFLVGLMSLLGADSWSWPAWALATGLLVLVIVGQFVRYQAVLRRLETVENQLAKLTSQARWAAKPKRSASLSHEAYFNKNRTTH